MRLFAGLLALLIAAPSFAAPMEVIRLEAPSVSYTSPVAAASAVVPTLSAGLTVTAAPIGLPSVVPAVMAAAPVAAASPRGPPASARSAAGVSQRVDVAARSWNVPVEKILQDRDVLLIGEDHSSLSTIETLARELPRLAKAGVTAVGIEGLKTPQQKAVDEYVSRRTDVLPRAALSFSPARVAAFTNLLNSARDNGIRVVALGLPLNEWAAQVTKLAAKKTGDPAETFPIDFKDQVDRAERRYEHGFNESLVEVLLTRRNKTMAELLWDAMGPRGKAVIVAGQAHVPGPDSISAERFHVRGDYGDLARELGAVALRAYSLTFTGGLFTSVQAAEDDREVRPEAHKVAVTASPDGAPAFVPLGPDRGLWHAGGRTPVAAH
ncbi:MAG: ChaN family lipoprotein [Elusimicrobia bacterium]|nr:ChaN family lipoprotein [Elusimicrobiota bacterium]